MSCSSDSEDNEHMKKFMEAADTNFLTDEMFKTNPNNCDSNQDYKNNIASYKLSQPKSQRYLDENESNSNADIQVPESMRTHISKKMSQIIQTQIEFCNLNQIKLVCKMHKSKVRLLHGADCYVKSYEEFEYDTKGPEKKPDMKRRKLPDEINTTLEEQLLTASINANVILAKTEVNSWAAKPERRDRLFHYNMGSNTTIHAKEFVNEFTKLRRKNKWNPSKIKDIV